MVDVDVLQIIKLLQYEMAWVVKDIAACVFSGRLPESLKGHTIVKVFTRMDFITNINTCFIKGVEYGKPPFCEFLERIVNKSRRALRPRINSVPHQRTGESSMCGNPEVLAGLCG